MLYRLSCHFFLLLLITHPEAAFAHGGVVGEDDLCIINIGYLKAHFKIYVPQESGHAEYCEDIPIRGESVFVMEYQHDSLNKSQIDFRIIRNVTGRGTFARVEDIDAIDELQAVTVHYAAPAIVPAVYTLLHNFEHDGEYIGIVSAADVVNGTSYTAVFPFEVGYTGIGIWPWVIGALLILQLNFWFMSRRRRGAISAAVLLAGMFAAGLVLADGTSPDVWVSDAGHFQVRYESDIEPIVINRIHSWILDVRLADGSPVDNASIKVSGGMPMHDHGLPTEPRAEKYLGGGRYRLAGLRFHMGGYWELRVSIDDGAHRDTVTIPLKLQ